MPGKAEGRTRAGAKMHSEASGSSFLEMRMGRLINGRINRVKRDCQAKRRKDWIIHHQEGQYQRQWTSWMMHFMDKVILLLSDVYALKQALDGVYKDSESCFAVKTGSELSVTIGSRGVVVILLSM